MQLTDIETLSRYFATGDGSDTSFSDADILRQSNTNYRNLIAMAIRAKGDWTLVGRTKAQTSITAGVREYILASTFLVLKAIEIKYPSSAQDYEKAKQIDQNSIAPRGKDDYTTARPEYDLYGDKIEIFLSAKTADIQAVTNGINVYYEDEITALAADSSETILPEFANRLLCLMNANDFCGVNDHHDKLKWIKSEMGQWPDLRGRGATGEKANFLNFLASRSEDHRPAIRPRREDYGQSEVGRNGGRGSQRNSVSWS